MAFEVVRSKAFFTLVLCVASFFLVWNVLSAVSGWWQSYWRVFLNLAVILALLFRFRHTKLLVKVWAALPLISLGAFLLTSALRAKWSPYPIEHAIGAALTLPIFLWANRAFSAPARET
jgi:hypothetical protein